MSRTEVELGDNHRRKQIQTKSCDRVSTSQNDEDCTEPQRPILVPGKTLLSNTICLQYLVTKYINVTIFTSEFNKATSIICKYSICTVIVTKYNIWTVIVAKSSLKSVF